VTSFDSGSGRDPIDPDYAALFRPDEALEAVDGDGELHFEPIVDPVIDPRDEEPPAAAEAAIEAEIAVDAEPLPEAPASPIVPADPVADTGRLFRSQGVAGHGEAVLALSSDHLGRLRTLDRQQAVPAEAGARPDAGPVDPDHLDDPGIPAIAAGAPIPGAGTAAGRGRRREPGGSAGVHHGSRQITGGAVYIIVIGVTLLVGFANALIASGDIGWPTGLALLASSVYAALTVRREDDTVAMIVPPIAFLLAALTAGQFFLGSSAGSLLNRIVVTFFTLADNWFWVIGATLAALVIVLVRRRRG
jgi:hypothetical protein